jgi:hypothetical protein
LNQTKILFVEDTHFQKQTFRNRTEIHGANGRLKLTIPVEHNKTQWHQKEHEVCVANDMNWQKHHWKSICNAYRSSPYFEYYEPDLAPFFEKKVNRLMTFNLDVLLKIMDLIDAPLNYKLVKWNAKAHLRMDTLVNAKKDYLFQNVPYTQVFESKNGFLRNLSILDVVFNLGPDSVAYLKTQKVISS